MIPWFCIKKHDLYARKEESRRTQDNKQLPQTPFWGRVKKNQGNSAIGFEPTVSKDVLNDRADNHTKVEEDLLVLTKQIDATTCYGYVKT